MHSKIRHLEPSKENLLKLFKLANKNTLAVKFVMNFVEYLSIKFMHSTFPTKNSSDLVPFLIPSSSLNTHCYLVSGLWK